MIYIAVLSGWNGIIETNDWMFLWLLEYNTMQGIKKNAYAHEIDQILVSLGLDNF